MARARFVADGIRVGLTKSVRGRGTAGTLDKKDGPLVANLVKTVGPLPDDDEDSRLQAFAELSSEQFQDLLRPAFQEDEWILILVGGVLGACAGLFQLLVVFGM